MAKRPKVPSTPKPKAVDGNPNERFSAQVPAIHERMIGRIIVMWSDLEFDLQRSI